ncbi:MAG: Flp pilus assembly protein CpaB [Nevskiales bacterium]
MSSKTLKLLALVTLVLALGLGFVAYQLSQRLTAPPVVETQQSNEQKPVAQRMAVVVVKPIAAHQAIKEDQVELVPVSILPNQFYESEDAVIGKLPLVDLDVGTTLTERLFSQSNLLSQSIPAGHRAMSLEINDVIAVGGFVQPGDIVDALLYIKATNKEVSNSQARLLLTEAIVLAYEERLLPESEADKADDKDRKDQRQRRQRTVVLAVPEKETVKVMLGASIGDIRLALHGQAEADPSQGTEVVDVAATGSQAKHSETDDIKPITLSELGAIKKQRSSKPRYVSRAIPVYRGNDVQTVRP